MIIRIKWCSVIKEMVCQKPDTSYVKKGGKFLVKLDLHSNGPTLHFNSSKYSNKIKSHSSIHGNLSVGYYQPDS